MITLSIYYKLVDLETGEVWTSTGVEGNKIQAIDFTVKMEGAAAPAGLTIQVPSRVFHKGQRLRAYQITNAQEILLVSGAVVTETWDGELYSYTVVDDNNFNVLVPGRIYGRDCDFTFGKSPCGYDLDAAKMSVEIVDIGQNYVQLNLSPGARYRHLTQNGVKAIGYLSSGEYLYLAEPAMFEEGSAVIYPVCNKKINDCLVYNQSENFGGFLHIPKAEEVVF